MGSESFTLAVSGGTYAQSDVGSNLAISSPSFGLTAGSATSKTSNYSYTLPTAATGTITKKALTIATPVVLTKEYDGTTAAAGASVASGGAVSGEVGSESFTLAVSGGTYAQSDVGSNLAISSPSFGLTAGNVASKTSNYSYTLPTAATGTITKKAITDIGGVTVKTRPVDGTTAASFDTTQATGAGVVSTELAGFRSGLSVRGSFPAGAKTTAGTYDVAVTYTLGDAGGFKASNYTQSDSGDTLRGTVTAKRVLVVTPTTVTRVYGEADPSEYKYTVAAKPGSSLVAGDSASTTTFFTSSPLTREPGTDAGEYAFSLVSSPAYGEGIAAKYAFEVATDAKYTITKRALTITAPVLTKVYDGGTGIGASTIASGGEVSGEASGESFTLTVSGGTYPQRDVGSNLVINSPSFGLTAGGGAKTTNYQYTLPTAATGSITKKAITDIGGVTVKTRPVDGTTSAKFDTAQATGAGVVTAEVAGFRGGLTVSGSFPEEAKTTAGEYDVPVTYELGDSGAFKASNYTQSDSGDTLRGRVTDKPELVLTPATIAENGGKSRVTATLSKAVSEAVTVTVSAAPVSPAEEGDFTLSANTKLTIAAGATTSTGTVEITANDNEVDAPNKEVTVSGAASGSTGESALADQTLTITDDDTRGLELSTTSVRVTEAAGTGRTAQYTVALGSQPTAAVTVAVSSGAVATATVSPATLSYTTTNWKTAQTVTVSAVDDAIDNTPERTTTIGHRASGGDYGSQSKNVDVTVSDDEGRSAFTVAAARVNEGDTGTASLKFTVTLSPAADGATTVRWATSDGTATAGPDYTAGSGTLNFAAGAMSKTVTVAVQGDEVDEANETLTLTLSDAGGGAELGAAKAATGTITDDDDRGLELSTTSVTVTEAVGTGRTAQYTVALGSQPTAAVTVAVSSGAVATATVSPATLSYTRTNWKTAQTVTVSAVDDAIDNTGDQRSATVTHTASGGDYGSQSKNVAVTVSDDDAAPTGITLKVDPSSVVENVTSAPTVTVTAAVNGTTRYADAKTVAVKVGGSDDSATEGTDYEEVSDLSIEIAVGAGSGEARFTLTPTDDAIAEGAEEVSVSGASDVPVRPATLTLSDDDRGLLALAIGEATVTEAADAAFALSVTLQSSGGEDLTLPAALEVTVTPTFETGAGKAVAADLSDSSAKTLTIGVGESSVSASFAIADDAVEEPAETLSFKLTVGTLPAGVSLGTTAAAATILDPLELPNPEDRTYTPTQTVSDELPAATGGAAPLSYTLVGASDAAVNTVLPGLSFTASNRTLGGTAGSKTGPVTLTYRVTDDNGATAEQTFTVTINDALALSAPADQVYTKGTAIRDLVLPAASGGTGTKRYTLTPNSGTLTQALPGLSFAAGSRTLSGTPSAVKAATTLTYTVTDGNNVTASATFTVQVMAALELPDPEDRAYTPTQTVSDELPVATGGAAPLSYTLVGASDSAVNTVLPGLSFTAGSRTLGGTAGSKTGPVTLTYRVRDKNGATATQSFDVTISDALTVSAPADQVYTKGTAIRDLELPAASGGTGTKSYTLTPDSGTLTDALPGLSFAAASRTLSGTPSAVKAATTLTYTVTDGNNVTASATFEVAVVAAPVLPDPSDRTYTPTQTVSDELPAATGGAAPLSYTLVPSTGTLAQALPGLSFTESSRTLGGTAGSETGPVTLTYKVTDKNGAHATQTFTVAIAKRVLVVTPTTVTRVYGEADPSEYKYTVAAKPGSSLVAADSASSTTFFTSSPLQRAAGTDAGEYAFSLMAAPAYGEGIAAKYAFEVAADAKYTITKRALTITGPVLTKVYDGGTGIGASTIASGGEVSGEAGRRELHAGGERWDVRAERRGQRPDDQQPELHVDRWRRREEDELQLHAAGGGDGIDHDEGSDRSGCGADEGIRRRHGDHGGDAERRRGVGCGEQPEPDADGDRGHVRAE